MMCLYKDPIFYFSDKGTTLKFVTDLFEMKLKTQFCIVFTET